MQELSLGMLGIPSTSKILETVWKMREEINKACEHDEDEDGPFVFNVYGDPNLNPNGGKIKRVWCLDYPLPGWLDEADNDKFDGGHPLPEWLDEADKLRVGLKQDSSEWFYSYYVLEVDGVWYRHIDTTLGARVDIIQANGNWFRHYDDGLYLWF